ncbi:MAG: pantetheine-phosphate adenylyltransferase [Kiritimatiellia bacterium]
MRIAVYPGTFDPLTCGHLDLAARGVKCFDKLILAVADSTPKTPLFSTRERVGLARKAIAEAGIDVEVDVFKGLLVDYVRGKNAAFILRGVRAFSDFEFEFPMALINRQLAPDIETLFLMPSEDFSYVSSGRVRELARLGGDVSRFVPVPPAPDQAGAEDEAGG